MLPPIFQTCAASNAVKALIGSSPVRLWPFGVAPESPALPYAVWQVVGGAPENYMDQEPDADRFMLQVDVYAATASSARNVAVALRDVIEQYAHIIAWRGESRDPETKHYRFTFDVDWHVLRT